MQSPFTTSGARAVLLAFIIVVGTVPMPALGAGATDVELTPASQATGEGQTVTYDVVVTNASGGVGAWEFTASVNNTSAAKITDISLAGSPGQNETSIASDGSSAYAKAALADTDQTGSVTIATITVRGVNEGSAGLSLSVEALGDESGSNYEVGSTLGASLTVENANFDYTGFSVTPIEANESANITASATVTNTGGASGTVVVPLTIDGTEAGTQEVSLAAGESTAVSFNDTLGDPGDYSVAIGQAEPITVSVNAPPSANVTATPTDAGVNETVTVSATASTDSDGTVDSFQWDVGSGRTIDDSGGEVGVQFSEPGEHRITVTVVDDDGATDSASINVSVTDGTGPTAVAAVNASNVVIDGAVRASASDSDDNVGIVDYNWSVEAPNGEVTTYTGEEPTIPITQTGTYTLNLTVADAAGNQDTASTTVEGIAPAAFQVTQSVNTTTVLTNESIAVTATVNNTGDVSGTTTVNLSIDGTVQESKSVTVEADGSKTVRFVTSLTRGEHTVTINDNDPVTVTARAPTNLSVQTVEAPSEVVQGATATVNVTVKNVGDTDGARDVTLTLGPETATKTVAVVGGETANVSLTVPTGEIAVGDTAYEVATNSDSASSTVTILEPANTSVNYALNTTKPLTNESLRVTATVNNTGDVSGDTPVTVYVDGEAVASKTVTVAGQGSETVEFTVGVPRGDHEVRVNEFEATTVTGLAPPNLSVSYSVNATTILTNEEAAVTATIENTGDLTGSTTVEFTVNGSVVATETVTVTGTNTTTTTYVPDLQRGTNTVAVNDGEPTTVEVLKPADVNIVAQNVTTTEFLSTQALNVTVYLNNTGDLNGSATVPLVVDGETIATDTVRVPANTVGEFNSNLTAVNFSVTRNWDQYGEHLVHAGDLSNTTITILRPTNPETTAEITAPTAGAVVNSSEVSIDFIVTNDSTGVAATEVRVDGGEWTEPIGSSVTEQLRDGEHTVSVRVIDNLGNTIASDTTTFVVDTQAPIANVSVSGPASPNSPATIPVSSSDQTLNTTVVEVRTGSTVVYREEISDEVSATDGITTVDWDGTNRSGSPVASGQYTVAVISTDEAGHTTEAITSVTVDTDRPTVNVTAVSSGGDSGPTIYVNQSDVISMTLEADDPTTNVSSVSALAQARSSAFQAFIPATESQTDGVWAATVDASELGSAGNYSVGGLATDEAGNVRSRTNDSVTVVLDTEAPTVGTTVSQADQSTGRVNVSSSEPLTGTPNVTAILPNGTAQSVPLSTSDDGWTGTFDLPEDGTYRVVVTGTDRAGNTGETRASTNVQTNVETVNRTVTLQNNETGTYIELHTDTDVNKAFAALTESDSPLATLSKDLTGAQFIDGQLGEQLNDNLTYAIIGMPVNESQLPEGVEPEDVQIRFYNETTGEWEEVGETTIQNRTVNGTTKRFYTVNVSHFSTYGAVAPDTTAPSLDETSLSPTGSPYDYDTDTVSVQFNYSDTQSGVNTSAVRVWVDGRLVSDGSATDTALQVTNEQTTVEMTDLIGSGEHTVTVQVVDEAGNAAANETKRFTVTEDVSAPTLSTTFTDGEEFQYGTSQIDFTLSLSDTQSGVDTSGISVTFDGTDVTEPATVTATEVSYTASNLDAGTHTITVTVPDEEGNVETITRTFTIDGDTDAPSINTATISPSADSGLLSADTSQLSLAVNYTDTESGVVAGDVVVEFNDGSGWTEVTDSAVVTRNETHYTAYNLDPGTYEFRVTVPDAEGNRQTVTKSVTIGEGTAPSITDVSVSPSAGNELLPANTSSVTIDLSFTDAEGDIEAVEAEFDGEFVSPVQNNGTVSYTATGLEAGTNHTLTVRITDSAGHTVTRTISFTIAAEATDDSQSSTGDGGGGGGGGGRGSGSASLGLNVVAVEDGATVQVRDASIGTSGTADLGQAASGAGVTVESVRISMRFGSSNFRLEVSTPAADGPAAPEGTTIASFSAKAISVESSNLDTREITFSVSESALPDGAGMDDIAVFVRTSDGWERVSVSGSGGTFTAKTSTFGTFAVTVLDDSEATSTDIATDTETATPGTETETEQSTSETETSTETETETTSPGLGIVHALIALAGALLVARRLNH